MKLVGRNSFDAERRLAPQLKRRKELTVNSRNSFDAERRLALYSSSLLLTGISKVEIPSMPKGV